MSGISALQGGQSDLELASADAAVLLRPKAGNPIITTLEATGGGLDTAKINTASGFITVGNWTKQQGVRLTNKPTINKIMSHGKGSPTALIPSEAEKSIVFTPQEFKLINLQNAWGFTPDAVSAASTHGGFTISIPELPARLQWQAVLLSNTVYNGKQVYKYWIGNQAEVGDRDDVPLSDSDVITHGVTLTFQTHPALPGVPVVFGVCGDGWQDINANNITGFYPAVTGITVTPTTASITAATGASHTRQLTVTDSNTLDRTAVATYVSSDPTKATVSTTGLVTGVAAGSSTVTATYSGFNATTTVTVT
jgi:hypothetical protein